MYKMRQDSLTEKQKPEDGGRVCNTASIKFMEQGDDGEYRTIPLAQVPEEVRARAAMAIVKAAIDQARNILNGVEQDDLGVH